MVKIAEIYPAGLKIGSFVTVDALFAPEAYRIENGVITADSGCALPRFENIKTQKIIKHPGISYLIVSVAEDLGIVLMRLGFGETSSYGPGRALIAWEKFKIYGGMIHAVKAFMRYMPSNKDSGREQSWASIAAKSLKPDGETSVSTHQHSQVPCRRCARLPLKLL